MLHRTFPVLVVLLAGCGGPPIANNQQVEATNNAVAAQPPSLPRSDEGDGTPVAAGSEIPFPFHGRYAFDAAACAARGSEGALTVEPSALRFYESVGTPTKVEPDGAGAVAVTARYTGEGQAWTTKQRLALTQNGARLTITSEDGRAVVRVRCG